MAKLRTWHLTDVGMVRDHNEDCGHADPAGRFLICSDGMGGHASGDVASRMAVDHIALRMSGWPPEFDRFARSSDAADARAALSYLEQAVHGANQAIHQRGRTERGMRGMGCTVDVVVVTGGFALCAHVGDSRQYLIREGRTRRLTTDHSMTPAPVPGRPTGKGMLTSALGPNPSCRCDTFIVELERGDRLLLCSDGLVDYFPDEQELAMALGRLGDEPGARWLIEQAKARGGADNITIVLAAVDSLDATPARAPTDPYLNVASEPPGLRAVSGEIAAVGGGAVPVPVAASASAPTAPLVYPAPAPAPAPPGPEPTHPRLGVLKDSVLFAGIPAASIVKIVVGAREKVLPPREPVPRVCDGNDTAWLILDGEYRGMLLYPEALAIGQQGFAHLEAPEAPAPAMALTRAQIARACGEDPAAGVKLMQNLARLLAAELRDSKSQ